MSRETSGAEENRKPRLRLVKTVNELKEARAVPKSFTQALEDLRSERRAEKRIADSEQRSGVEVVEGMELLGISENQLEELLACLPGNNLHQVRFAQTVDINPDPTREGKKVFSDISRNHEGKIEVDLFSSDHYGGDGRARGLMVDEMSTELLRAYAKANRYSDDLDAARAVEMFVKDKMPAELVSGQAERKMDQAWETLVCMAMHTPVSEDLSWEDSFKLSLMATHGILKKDAEEITRALAKTFKADPNGFVPSFQEKEKGLKRTLRLHELSQTISGAIANTPIVSIYTRGLHDPDALVRFAAAVKEKVTGFHIENERSVLSRCVELALNAAYARREAELDGSSFPEAMNRASAQARSLGSEWGKLLSKRKEISDVLVESWHQAMSDYKE